MVAELKYSGDLKWSKPHKSDYVGLCTQSGQALRELPKYKVILPDEVAGWLLMRRAGLTKEQKQLIQTTVETETAVEKVEKALYLTRGQNHKVPSPAKFNNMRGRWKTDRAHFAEDEVYYEDDGEYPEDNAAYDGDGNPVDYDGEEGYWQKEEWDDVQSTYYGSTWWSLRHWRVWPSLCSIRWQQTSVESTPSFSWISPVVAVAGGQQFPLAASPSASGSQSPSRTGSKGKSKG